MKERKTMGNLYVRSNTDWFKDAKWGIFNHYLASKETKAEDWNMQIEDFDVEGLTEQLESIGTKYYFITVGQNSGHYCSPNSTYDSFVGIQPSKCAKRDLISDFYHALDPKGIRLLVYLPSDAPAQDPVVVQKLGWKWGFKGGWGTWGTERTGERLAEFQMKWEAIIREWSLRWGKKVAGWWIDGCYFADEMYRHPDPPNFKSFAAALKAGNKNSIIAFNPGVKVPVISLTEYEDYTAGEISKAFPVCPGRWVNGAQYHILSYLSAYWGGIQGEEQKIWGNVPFSQKPRFVDEFVLGYTKDVNTKGGVVTWDVPITKSGLIPAQFMDQLKVFSHL
jgi:hypothetical protein